MAPAPLKYRLAKLRLTMTCERGKSSRHNASGKQRNATGPQSRMVCQSARMPAFSARFQRGPSTVFMSNWYSFGKPGRNPELRRMFPLQAGRAARRECGTCVACCFSGRRFRPNWWRYGG